MSHGNWGDTLYQQTKILHHTLVSCEAPAWGKRRGDDNSDLGRQHIHLFLLLDEEKIGFRSHRQCSRESFARGLYPEVYKYVPDYLRTIIDIPEFVTQTFFKVMCLKCHFLGISREGNHSSEVKTGYDAV